MLSAKEKVKHICQKKWQYHLARLLEALKLLSAYGADLWAGIFQSETLEQFTLSKRNHTLVPFLQAVPYVTKPYSNYDVTSFSQCESLL